jgi:two-component sensor histidine kinase
MDEASPETPEVAWTRQARHRVANLFQLLSTLTRMRMQRTRDPETRRQITWLLDAMGALSILQRRLWSAEGGEMAAFLAEMAEAHWSRRIGDRPIALIIDAVAVTLPEQMGSTVALIAHELVVNAIAHAFADGRAGRIEVRLERLGDGRAALTVADDGVGFDAEAVGAETLGLWLVKGLTSQLRGRFTVVSPPGAAARLEFPLPADGG